MFQAKLKNKSPELKVSYWDTFGTGEDRKYFLENLSMLVNSGTGVFEALATIQKETRSKGMRRVIDFLKEDVDSGSPLWEALKKIGIFSDSEISLIRIGENSGKLSQNLKTIVLQREKDQIFYSKIRSAMLYPAIVFSLTAVVGIGVAWFILPKLSLVFNQLKMNLPWITRALIAIGTFLQKHGAITIPAVIIFLAILIYFIFVNRRTKFLGQAIMFHFPGIKELLQEVELSRFGYILGTLLDSGIPVVECLNSLANSSPTFAYRKFFAKLKEKIEEGNSFQKSFALIEKSERMIPNPVQQMIGAAENSGKLQETLLKIGEVYEGKLDNTAKNIPTILEPILLVIVWLGVVMVAMAVILPIYSLVGGLNQNRGTVSAVPQKIDSAGNVEVIPAPEAPPIPILDAQIKMVEILPTGTGFLNVRSLPSKNGKIVGRVIPGNKYEMRSEKDGWVEVVYLEGKVGWVSGDYVKK
jgi:type IV pilus assembly protein PilC